MPTRQLMTPKAAAAYLGVDVSTLRRWASAGRIQRVYVGGVGFYRPIDLDRIKPAKVGRPRGSKLETG